MGCNIYNYIYTSEIKDEKYSITIASNLPTDNININKNCSSKLSEKLNKKDFSHSKEITISSNVDIDNLIKNNPFPFVKIKPNMSRYFK